MVNLSNLALAASFLTGSQQTALDSCPSYDQLVAELGQCLSNTAVISPRNLTARWSDYHSPSSHSTVQVGSTADVATTIKYANDHRLPFLVQGGGAAPATTFNLTSTCDLGGIVIDMSLLNQVQFASDRRTARIGGGIKTDALVQAAYGNSARVATASCNCAGMGSILGGALSRAAGLYGWGVQNILSLEVVLANSTIIEVNDSNHPDLFWAMKGAAASLGVVTEITLKTHPVPQSDNYAWQAQVYHDGKDLEAIIGIIEEIIQDPLAECHLLLTTSGPPNYIPILATTPFYISNNRTEALAKYKPLLDLSSQVMLEGLYPYDTWNSINDGFCVLGGTKFWYGASLASLDPDSWRAAFDRYTNFVAEVGGNNVGLSGVLVENYNTQMAVALQNTHPSAFAQYALPSEVVILGSITDAAHSKAVDNWARDTRDILRSGDGLNGSHSNYVNFAHGDETLEQIWGANLKALKEIKRYDKEVFNEALASGEAMGIVRCPIPGDQSSANRAL